MNNQECCSMHARSVVTGVMTQYRSRLKRRHALKQAHISIQFSCSKNVHFDEALMRSSESWAQAQLGNPPLCFCRPPARTWQNVYGQSGPWWVTTFFGSPPVYKGRRKDTKDYALEPVPESLWFQRRQACHCQVKQRPNSKKQKCCVRCEKISAVLMWCKTLHLHK